MAMQRRDNDKSGTLKRRGMIAGAAALVAGWAAKEGAAPVSATTGQPLILGQPNTSNPGTTIDCSGPAGNGLQVTNSGLGSGGILGSARGVGVRGQALIIGVQGEAGASTGPTYGVVGTSSGNQSAGVQATATGGPGSVGLLASVTGSGGIAGVYATGAVSGSIGVFGTSDDYAGVFGNSTSSTGSVGTSSSGHGVYGSSASHHGVGGITSGNGKAGVIGTGNVPGSTGISGMAADGAFAGYFTGQVYINGPLMVNDPTNKHGIIAHTDGTHRLLYSVESSLSWVEDIGEGKLVDGKTEIKIDADLAGVIVGSGYHVFLAPYGDSKGLYVADRTATGFVVREQQGGTSTIPVRVSDRREAEVQECGDTLGQGGCPEDRWADQAGREGARRAEGGGDAKAIVAR